MNHSSSTAVPHNSFWSDIAPREHLVQIYADDSALLNALDGFVTSGMENDEAVVLITTPEHLQALDERMAESGFNLEQARNTGRCTSFDTEDTLPKFLLKDWPDEAFFQHFVRRVVDCAKGRKVRIFDEMVAQLLARGNHAAMLRLEQLWQRACSNHQFVLFCAYPRHGMSAHVESSIRSMCSKHSSVIS